MLLSTSYLHLQSYYTILLYYSICNFYKESPLNSNLHIFNKENVIVMDAMNLMQICHEHNMNNNWDLLKLFFGD